MRRWLRSLVNTLDLEPLDLFLLVYIGVAWASGLKFSGTICTLYILTRKYLRARTRARSAE